MGGRLALTKADVTTPDGTEYRAVSVMVQGTNIRLVGDMGDQLYEADDVRDVRRSGQRDWLLTTGEAPRPLRRPTVDALSSDTPDPEPDVPGVYLVHRLKGCSTCGGARSA